MNPDITYMTLQKGENVYLKTSGNRRKLIGTIKPVEGGFAYFPLRSGPGETFPTVAAVKRSLEAP